MADKVLLYKKKNMILSIACINNNFKRTYEYLELYFRFWVEQYKCRARICV